MAEKTTVFVVLDPTCMEQDALVWGEQIVRESGNRRGLAVNLHVYCCINEDSVAVVPSDSEAHAQAATEKRVHAWIERLVAVPRNEGIAVETEVEWHRDWRKALVVAAERADSALVVKNMTQHSRFVRLVRETSDWTLLREAPCPVLLVKSGRPFSVRQILVAIKYNPEEDVYEKANDQLLAAGRRLADDLGANLHVVTAYTGSHPDRQRFADRCGVERSQVSAVIGPPEKVIAETAARQKADLVIIARVAQSGSAKEIGNTAQKVIDALDTEVLVLPVND